MSEKKEKEVKLPAHEYPKTEVERLPEVKEGKSVSGRKKEAAKAIALLRSEGLLTDSDAEAIAKRVRVAVK